MDAVGNTDWIQKVANGGLHIMRRGDVDPDMTRAAREQRSAWRLDNLAEWRRGLEELGHYDPEYPYDIGHDYDWDWTTDPEYTSDGAHFSEYDNGGAYYPSDLRRTAVPLYMCDTGRDRLGNRVEWQPWIYFGEAMAVSLNLLTRQGTPKNMVSPGLVVLPPVFERPSAIADRPDMDRIFRIDMGDPAPELVFECLSPTTAEWKLNGKMRLYAALGIKEYLVYDPGGMCAPGSPARLLAYRLKDGVYRAIKADPELSAPACPAFASAVFGTHIRMQPWARHQNEGLSDLRSRFQWHDPARGFWRDPETDKRIRHEREVLEGYAEEWIKNYLKGKVKIWTLMSIDLLHVFLENALTPSIREQVAAVWQEKGPPPAVVDRIRTVQRTPEEWHAQLLGAVGNWEGDAAPETDKRIRFQQEVRTEAVIAVLHVFLDKELNSNIRDRVAAVWRQEGAPANAIDRMLAVRRTPGEWHSLLLELVAS